MAEVFAWPEAVMYLYSAGASSPAAMAYVENFTLEANYEWIRYHNLTTGAWAARSTYVLGDKKVRMSFESMWTDSTALLRANSGTAWNMSLSASSYLQTGAVQIWSAVFSRFSLAGQANGLFRINGQLEATDYSAI